MWSCYHLMRTGGVTVYIGITSRSPTARETEHRLEGKMFTYQTVKELKYTEVAARQWERLELAEYRRSHNGQNPLYNNDSDG